MLKSNTPPTYPPRIEEVRTYFGQKGMTEAEAEFFFLFYEMKKWQNRKGYPLQSWKNTAYQWIATILKYEPWRFSKAVH